MSNWLSQALERGYEPSGWLAEARQQALAKLKQREWPTRKTEDWRYVPLGILNRFAPAAAETTNTELPALPGLDAVDLLFNNGKLVSTIGELETGLEIIPLNTLKGDQVTTALSLFGRVKPEKHLFGLINDVLANDGVLIRVAEGCAIEKPIRLVHCQRGGEAHTRHLVQVGENAGVTIIEQHLGDSSSLNTSFCEFQIGNSGKLNHHRYAMQTGAAISIGGCHYKLADHSQLHSTVIGFGSDLARLDVDIIHSGEHANALQNSVYLLGEKELFDLHSNVEHCQPNGTTEQNVRGIVGAKGKAVFNGRIHIHRYAQKTQAELNNRNLLLTRNAEVYTKPELEIYADDVRCAHGATVAELDSKALFYLRSRGVSEHEARIMLNFGFINELIEQIELPPVVNWLQATLKDRFSGLRHQLEEV